MLVQLSLREAPEDGGIEAGSHARMIGASRGRITGIAAALALGLLLAARPADPAQADPVARAEREAYLRDVAGDADAAWAELQAHLEDARAAARQGAALIVAGDQPPQAALEEAADGLDESEPAAVRARDIADRLRGVLASMRPGGEAAIPELPTTTDLASIATQLRAAAEAAAPFLERRHAAEEALRQLGQALAALEANALDAAERHLQSAAEARQVLVDWERPPATLDLWLETTGTMIDAARRIADAARAGDDAAARRAADDYAAAAADARRADVSLGLSLSETGGGLTSTPMQRLAEALATVAQARAQAAALGG